MTMPAVSSVPAGAAVALTTTVPANVTQLVLSSGTWLVWGFVDATLASASLTALIASLSLTSGALSGQAGNSVSGNRLFPEPIAQALQNLVTASGTESMDVGPTILTVPPPNASATPNPTATLYLVAQAAFSAGAVSAYGSLFALQLPS